LGQILFDRVVKDGFDTERPQPLQSRSYFELVLAGYEVAVEGGLHQRGKESLAQDAFGELHQLETEGCVFKNIAKLHAGRFLPSIRLSPLNRSVLGPVQLTTHNCIVNVRRGWRLLRD
jgi:hypothetical protein